MGVVSIVRSLASSSRAWKLTRAFLLQGCWFLSLFEQDGARTVRAEGFRGELTLPVQVRS